MIIILKPKKYFVYLKFLHGKVLEIIFLNYLILFIYSIINKSSIYIATNKFSIIKTYKLKAIWVKIKNRNLSRKISNYSRFNYFSP